MHLSASTTLPTKPLALPAPHVTLVKSGDKPAFYASYTGWTLRVSCDIELTFRTGCSLRFASELGVFLDHPDTWGRDTDVVIVVEKRWGTSEHYLAAMLPAAAELAGLDSFVLGGFRLDPTGAVLADSFWDIADRDEPARAESNFERMVDLFVANHLRGYATDLDDLKAHDLADAATLKLFPKAKQEADRRLHDRDIADDAVTYDRQGRVEHLANMLAGYLQPNGEGWDVARRAGYASRELGEIWPDVVARVGALSAPARPGLSA